MAWRRKELVAAYLGIPGEDWAKRVYCRQAILLLYAHLEGFVKYAVTQYLEAIRESGAATANLCPELLGLALSGDVNRAANQNTMQVVGAVVHKVLDDPSSLPQIPTKNVVKTHANVSSRRLRAILAVVGLDRMRFASIEADVIDRLLKWRNGIAHGEGRYLDDDDYRIMHHKVLDFLDELKTYLEDSASNDEYLR